MKIFLYSYSLISCHLFLISSASVRSMPFLSFIVPIFAWVIPLVSLIFLKRSLVFPIQLFSFISLHLSWRKTFLSLLPILCFFFFLIFQFFFYFLNFKIFNSFFGICHSGGYIFLFLLGFSLLFFSLLFVRPPQAIIIPFCISFPWGWSWSLSPAQCH